MSKRTPRIAIVGSGFSGLCLGAHLKRAGIDSFTIHEKSDCVGGTWRDNTYPGAACDSPSFAYCFSFAQKTDWSRKWVEQPEILAYMEHCADALGLRPHIRLRSEIASARFDEEAGVWKLRTVSGEEIEAEILVSGVGQLNRPHVPAIAGLEDFEGERFHSARWNHEVDLAGKTVAVIGNAASAIQLIPRIAPRAKRLLVFQRSANWMLPRRDRAYRGWEKRLFTRFPLLAKLYRWWLWASFELRWPVFRGSRFLGRRLEKLAEREMRAVVEDPALQDALVPDYPIGGKRVLISDDYYQSLNRENVDVVLHPIDHLEADAVVTADGTRHPVDVAILATGFESTSFLAPMEIIGLEGRSLREEWGETARAYLGVTVSGYPNFFMMYGPNTNLGHNSIIFMIECQTRYIVQCIQAIAERDLRFLDLRRDVMDAYNAGLQKQLAGTVWVDTDHSWYKNDAGVVTNNWSGSTIRYWWATRHADLGLYRQQVRSGVEGESGRAAA